VDAIAAAVARREFDNTWLMGCGSVGNRGMTRGNDGASSEAGSGKGRREMVRHLLGKELMVGGLGAGISPACESTPVYHTTNAQSITPAGKINA
jgi:hypothetical protein